jgi:hypothetical protein
MTLAFQICGNIFVYQGVEFIGEGENNNHRVRRGCREKL